MDRGKSVALALLIVAGCREPVADRPAETPEPVGVEPVAIGPVESEPVYEGPMVEIPAGEFMRGAGTDSSVVRLPGFWIDRTEVSNAEYERCVASGDCAVRRLSACTRDGIVVADPAPYLDPEQPAVCMTHGEAAGYCFWRGARLASRSEWEKAARGVDGRSHPWGEESPTCDRANFHACGRGTSEKIGSHPDHPSPYGALDMAGNVAEWVMPDVDPTGMFEQSSEAEIRGGHFASAPEQLHSAARVFLASTQERTVEVGFRCVGDGSR